MSTATAKKPARKASSGCPLLEIASGMGRVDHETGIIYDVKVVGLQSRNKGRSIGLDPQEFNGALNEQYSYSPAALEAAIPLYEGVAVKVKHPKSKPGPDGQRIVEGRDQLVTCGELRNVRMKPDGLYADVHTLKAHPDTALILETADRMPGKIAMSHNAVGVPVLRNGKAVIEKILQVNSVDFIDDQPGTTNGLFESHQEIATVKKQTIKQVIESLPAAAPSRLFLEAVMSHTMPDGKKMANSAMEMEMPAGTHMMPDGSEMADSAMPSDQVGDALRSVVMSIVDDDTLDSAAKISKIKEIFKLKDKLVGTETAATEEENSVDPVKTQESLTAEKQSPLVKQLTEDVAALKAERDELAADKHARALLETAGREVLPVRLNAVKALKSDADRKQLIETWAKKDEADFVARRPRTSAPLFESAGAPEVMLTGDKFVAALKR